MGLKEAVVAAARHRQATILAALVTTFAGVALFIDRPHGTVLEWLVAPFLAFGAALFTWAVWPRPAAVPGKRNDLASRLILRATFDGRLIPFFPSIGVGVMLGDLVYNLLFSATPALQAEDIMVLLGASFLVGYRLIPERFDRERDFVLLFCLLLNAILVVPLLLARVYYDDLAKSVNVYSWVALAPETSAVLSAVGVSNTIHSVPGDSAPGLTFTPMHVGAQVTIVITTACSGIYSFGIFASAFVAFILTEYTDVSRRVWLMLGLGLLAAYIANILRMVVIVLVGYYTDSAETDLQNMLVAHSYAGWLIFLLWISLFWGSLLKFLPPERNIDGQLPPLPKRRPKDECSICSGALSPAIASTRCACGAIFHRRCFPPAGRCPNCGRTAGTNGMGFVHDA